MAYIDTSIFDLFKVGPGPSSSHTIGPMKAGFRFREVLETQKDSIKSDAKIEVSLYGSLSLTGKGHGTDRALLAGLLGWTPENCDYGAFDKLLRAPSDSYKIKIAEHMIDFTAANIRWESIPAPASAWQNTMVFRLKSASFNMEKEYYSIGGGFILCKDEPEAPRNPPLYRYGNWERFCKILETEKISLAELILTNEEAITGVSRVDICKNLDFIISVMCNAVERGISTDGILPGSIKLARKASVLMKYANNAEYPHDIFLRRLNAYAMGVSEENASGHQVVTAPTLGSAGLIPGLIYALIKHENHSLESIRNGMLAAFAIGAIARHNASIAGAEVGCQGEIGVAAAMAAALVTYAKGYPYPVVGNAAEIALEHHLGMTCDPIDGYVQIPCIERNAVGAVAAYNAYILATSGDPSRQKISFDEVVEVMLETGRDMSTKYKETSRGGLALCSINC